MTAMSVDLHLAFADAMAAAASCIGDDGLTSARIALDLALCDLTEKPTPEAVRRWFDAWAWIDAEMRQHMPPGKDPQRLADAISNAC